MAITKDVGRQFPLLARVPFTYLTLETDAGAASGGIRTALVLAAADIPPNSIITRGQVVVTTAWVGPTVAQLDVGDTAQPTRYASNVDLKTAGGTPFTVTGALAGFKYSEWDTVDLRVDTTVAASTAGEGYIDFEYYTVDRVTSNV